MSSVSFNKLLSGTQKPPSITAAVFPKTNHVFLPIAGLIPGKMDFPLSNNAMDFPWKDGLNNGEELLKVLKNAYGEYPCIRFKKEDGHPVLNDITMLYTNGEEPELLEHPYYINVPEGEFLFRSVDF